jgi:dihydropyrimidinase
LIGRDLVLDLAIRGGTTVTERHTVRQDVGVSAGRVVALGDVGPARQELDATGCYVIPGAVDGHTHLDYQRDPTGPRSVDDYYFGTLAAAFGGITSVVDYARQPHGVGLMEAVQRRVELASQHAVIDFGFHLIPTDHTETTLREIPALVEAGFPSVKVFLHRVDDAQALRMLQRVASASGLTMVHCESLAINDDAAAQVVQSGRSPARAWAEARPIATELLGLARATELVAYSGAPVCIVHVASAAALHAVSQAQGRGLPMWAETRPCYLLLTHERYEEPPPRHLMYTGYPPLRDAASVQALWSGLVSNVIQTVASDHGGWSLEQKLVGDPDISRLPQGLPSLETQMAGVYSEGVHGGRLDVNRFVAVTATAPARLLGLYPQKGDLAVGSDADIVLLNPGLTRRVALGDLHGRVDYEPLEGLQFTGWPVVTISRGEIIVRDGQFLGQRGRGQLVRRNAFNRESAPRIGARASA